MNHESRNEYIALLRERYQKSERKQRAVILDELCRSLEVHRKSAIRMMNSKARTGKRGRKHAYSELAQRTLRKLWVAMDYMCPKK